MTYGYGIIAVAGAVAAAGAGPVRRPLARVGPDDAVAPGAGGARAWCAMLHSGHIGDYIAWWSAGASLIGGICLLALR